jgi:hypothetical protein
MGGKMAQVKTPKESPAVTGGKTKETPNPSGVFKEGGSQEAAALKRVDNIEDLIRTDNSVMTYAIIRGRTNTLLRLKNKNGRISVSIITMAGNRPINSISIYKIPRLVEALKDLAEDLSQIINASNRKSKARVY